MSSDEEKIAEEALGHCLLGDHGTLRSLLADPTTRKLLNRSFPHLLASVLGGSEACTSSLLRFYDSNDHVLTKASSVDTTCNTDAPAVSVSATLLGPRAVRRMLSAVVVHWSALGHAPRCAPVVARLALDVGLTSAQPQPQLQPEHVDDDAEASSVGPAAWPYATGLRSDGDLERAAADPNDALLASLSPQPAPGGKGKEKKAERGGKRPVPPPVRDTAVEAVFPSPRVDGLAGDSLGVAGCLAGGEDGETGGTDADVIAAVLGGPPARERGEGVPDPKRPGATLRTLFRWVELISHHPCALYPVHLAGSLGSPGALEWLVRTAGAEPNEPIAVTGAPDGHGLGAAFASDRAGDTGIEDEDAVLSRVAAAWDNGNVEASLVGLEAVVDSPLVVVTPSDGDGSAKLRRKEEMVDARGGGGGGGGGGRQQSDGFSAAPRVPSWRRHHASEGLTALHVACSAGHDACASLLVTLGADGRAKTARGLTPWDHAALQGHTGCTQAVPDRPAAISLALTGSDAALGRLLHAGVARPGDTDEGGFTLLHHIAWSGHVPTAVEVLFAMGVPRVALDTAIAGGEGCAERVAELLAEYFGKDEMGDGGARDGDGDDGQQREGRVSPGVSQAARSASQSQGFTVLRPGWLDRTDNDDGRSPLDVASRRGHLGMVLLLLRLGASPRRTNRSGRIPLHGAAHSGHPLVVWALIRHSTIDVGIGIGHDANHDVDVDVDIEPSSEHGGNAVAACDPRGTTPLHMAASRGHVLCALLLLCGGHPPLPRSRSGRSPFDVAVAKRRWAVARILGGWPVLRMTVASGGDVVAMRERAVEMWREQGVIGDGDARLTREEEEALATEDIGMDLAGCGIDGSGLLHVAVEVGDADAVGALLARSEVRGTVNRRNDAGDAPLHVAAALGSIEMCRALVDAGANRRQRACPTAGARAAAENITGTTTTTASGANGGGVAGAPAPEDSPLPYEVALANGHAKCAAAIFPESELYERCAAGDTAAVLALLEAEEQRDSNVMEGGSRASGTDVHPLIGRHPDIDEQGRTPMHMAVAAAIEGRCQGTAGRAIDGDGDDRGGVHLVTLLATRGGAGRIEQLFAKDNSGETPLNMASLGDGGEGDGRDHWSRDRGDGHLGWLADLARPAAALCSASGLSEVLAAITTAPGGDGRDLLATALSSGGRHGLTPLHHAAAALRLGAVRHLLRIGASATAVSTGGRTPLHEALSPSEVISGNTVYRAGTIASLRESGKADLAAIVDALLDHCAAADGHVNHEGVRHGGGAGVANSPSSNPSTGRAPQPPPPGGSLSVLLGADVSLSTPLHLAAGLGDSHCVRSLLRVGADPFATDTDGRLPAILCPRGAVAARRLLDDAMSSGVAMVRATAATEERAVDTARPTKTPPPNRDDVAQHDVPPPSAKKVEHPSEEGERERHDAIDVAPRKGDTSAASNLDATVEESRQPVSNILSCDYGNPGLERTGTTSGDSDTAAAEFEEEEGEEEEEVVIELGALFLACEAGDRAKVESLLGAEEQSAASSSSSSSADGVGNADVVDDDDDDDDDDVRGNGGGDDDGDNRDGGGLDASGVSLRPAPDDPNVDERGRNVMHVAVEAATRHPHRAGEIPVLLATRGRGRIRLLFTPDNAGETPLHLAAHLATRPGDGSESDDGDGDDGESHSGDGLEWLTSLARPISALCSLTRFTDLLACVATHPRGGARLAAVCLATGDTRFRLSPLHHAAASLNLPVVRRLLRMGAPITLESSGGRLPIHEALDPSPVLRGGSVYVPGKIARLRRKRQGDLPAVVRALLGDPSPPSMAAPSGSTDVSDAVLHTVSHADASLSTPLHLAASIGSPKATGLLLSLGADPFARDASGHIPLILWRGPLAGRRLIERAMERSVRADAGVETSAPIGDAGHRDDNNNNNIGGDVDDDSEPSSDEGVLGAHRGIVRMGHKPSPPPPHAARRPTGGKRRPPPRFSSGGSGDVGIDSDGHAITRPDHGKHTPPRAPRVASDGSAPLQRTDSLGALRTPGSGSSKADLLDGIYEPGPSLTLGSSPTPDLPPIKSPPPSRQRSSLGTTTPRGNSNQFSSRPEWDARPGQVAQPRRYAAEPSSKRAQLQMRR